MHHRLLRIPRVKTALTLISQLFLCTACVFGDTPTSPDVAWQTKPEPTVQSTIEANDQAFVQAVLAKGISKLDELLSEGSEQSPGECMHAWAKRGDRWVHVGRQSTRFEAY